MIICQIIKKRILSYLKYKNNICRQMLSYFMSQQAKFIEVVNKFCFSKNFQNYFKSEITNIYLFTTYTTKSHLNIFFFDCNNFSFILQFY
jgi:hypothetical protein